MPRTREVSFSTRGRLLAAFIALVGVIGVFLAPAASDAAPTRRTTTTRVVRTTTTTIAQTAADDVPTLAADTIPTLESAPADQEAALASPTFTFPTFTFPPFNFPPLPHFPEESQLLQNVFANIQRILSRVFQSLCGLVGGSFCASP